MRLSLYHSLPLSPFFSNPHTYTHFLTHTIFISHFFCIFISFSLKHTHYLFLSFSFLSISQKHLSLSFFLLSLCFSLTHIGTFSIFLTFPFTSLSPMHKHYLFIYLTLFLSKKTTIQSDFFHNKKEFVRAFGEVATNLQTCWQHFYSFVFQCVLDLFAIYFYSVKILNIFLTFFFYCLRVNRNFILLLTEP